MEMKKIKKFLTQKVLVRTALLCSRSIKKSSRFHPASISTPASRKPSCSPTFSKRPKRMETRPDTRPKAVADGWAGARLRVFTHCDRFQFKRDNLSAMDGRMDGQSLL